MRLSCLLLALPSLCLAFAAGAASGWEDHARLRAAAAEALDSDRVRIAVDPNTRVPRCAEAPRGRVRARSRNSASVEIFCERPAWRIYVPAREDGLKKVAVLGAPLPSGHVLKPEDLTFEQRDAASLGYGAFDSAGAVVGRSLRRAMPAGAVLGPNDLQSEQLVATGDTVTLISRHKGLEVRMQGRALSHGARNQQITVVNTRSGRKVDAVVVAAGQVEVAP